MATYQIEWKKSALRELKRLDRKIIPRIISAVESLSTRRNDAFPVKNETFPRRNAAFPVKNETFAVENATFPVVNRTLPTKNEAFPVVNEALLRGNKVFPGRNAAFGVGNEAFGIKKGAKVLKKGAEEQFGCESVKVRRIVRKLSPFGLIYNIISNILNVR